MLQIVYNANGRGAILDLLLAKWKELADSVTEMAAWAAVTTR